MSLAKCRVRLHWLYMASHEVPPLHNIHITCRGILPEWHGMQAVKLLCLLRQGPAAMAAWQAGQAEAEKAGDKLLVLEMRRQMAHLWAQQGDVGQALPALQQVSAQVCVLSGGWPPHDECCGRWLCRAWLQCRLADTPL